MKKENITHCIMYVDPNSGKLIRAKTSKKICEKFLEDLKKMKEDRKNKNQCIDCGSWIDEKSIVCKECNSRNPFKPLEIYWDRGTHD